MWKNGLMKNWTRIASFALLIGAAACSPGATTAQAQASAAAPAAALAVHPVSGLTVVPLTVTTASGVVHLFKVEVAATFGEQERGLMFRAVMGADEGMIFPMDPPRRTAFWMKNTVIPLDIVYVGADHKVLNIAANAVPYDLTPLPSEGAAAGVLELNGGRAAAIGLKPGDSVTW
jgi:uncharacterized membrane protein (UPF0127 family)